MSNKDKPQEKKCTICERVKPIGDFPPTSRPGYTHNQCKECRNKIGREHRANIKSGTFKFI